MKTFRLASITLLLVSSHLAAKDSVGDEFFERDIRPILVEKCQSCHGEKKSQGGLRLDSREVILKGGDRGPAIVPGKPEDSLLIKAIGHADKLKMPPTGKLTAAEIEKLKRWVAEGAKWPNAAKTAIATGDKFQPSDAHRKWWAFQPVRAIAPPNVVYKDWPRSEIDRFTLAEMEKRNISPAKQTDRRMLIRRASFDLTGLPPTPEEVEAFLKDESSDAFAKVVDRLLASSAYGQRWGRHWLDIVRYADYHDGNPKARNPVCEPLEAWRYRDWVVESLNRDLPFDKFIVHQIAGDLLTAPDGKAPYADGLIATAFLVNGAWDRGDADKEKMVSDMVDDQIDTIGKAFMGLTLGCSRCHDHKFDPLSQNDYYALAGIFYSTRMLKELGTKGGEMTLQRIPLAPKELVAKREEQVKKLAEINAKITEFDKKKMPADPMRKALIDEREQLQKTLLPEPPLALAVSEGGVPGGLFPKIQDVPLHIRGSYTRLGPVVPRRMPEFFAGQSQPTIRGSGRLELANWIASKENLLTARVLVNRVWHWHFGTGIVRTPNNFGMLSEPPSHPELLDWLATQFLNDGWSIKKLHRRIMLSATYQQTSMVDSDHVAKDPENRWLGRFSPRRLEAEAIRDTMLRASGRLDLATGGSATDNLNTTRRSLYVQTARWDRSNFSTLFDAANPDASEERRNVSTVAPQSLFLLNHEFVLTQAKYFAEQLARDVPSDETAKIHRAFKVLFARPASADEVALARKIIATSSWQEFAHVLLCANELVYLD